MFEILIIISYLHKERLPRLTIICMQEKVQSENQSSYSLAHEETSEQQLGQVQTLTPPPFQLKASDLSSLQQDTIQNKGHHDGCGCASCAGKQLKKHPYSPSQFKTADLANPRQQVSQHKGHQNGCSCEACGGKKQLKKNSHSPAQLQAAGGVVQFRLPTFTSLRNTYRDSNLGLTEAVMRDRVGTLLERMNREGRLTSTDPIPTILDRIFATPGDMNEAAFNAAVDTSSANSIYRDVMDATAPVRAGDKPGFRAAIRAAITHVRAVQGATTDLQRVFGSRSAAAGTIYVNAGDILQRLHDDDALLDRIVTTDYNEDDPETFSGGWAFNDGSGGMGVHFSPDTVRVTDRNESIVTLIHEACHLASSGVTDLGYYPPSTNEEAWAAYTEDQKIGNAAHFEELIHTRLGTSVFAADRTFTPGRTVSGGTVSREARARNQASEYFRNNWNHALTIHEGLREILQDIRGGDTSSFQRKKRRILTVSRKFGMTVHEQTRAHATLTDLDITISESIVRGTMLMSGALPSIRISSPIRTDAGIRRAKNQLIQDAIRSRPLRGSFRTDRLLQAFIRRNARL